MAGHHSNSNCKFLVNIFKIFKKFFESSTWKSTTWKFFKKNRKTSNIYFLIGNSPSPLGSDEAIQKYQKRKMCHRSWKIVIYKESTDPVKSIDLYEYRCSTPPLPEIEVFDAIVSLETGSTKTPNYTFEIKKTYTENFSTRKVSCIAYFDVKIVYCSKPFLLVKSRDKSNDISGES